jgi:hypothetical protein
MRKTMLALVVIAAALCLPAGRTSAQPAKAMDAMITGAKTAADHEALAAEYDKEAADAKAKAVEHRKMGAAYKGQPAVTGGKAAGVSAMPEHCERRQELRRASADVHGHGDGGAGPGEGRQVAACIRGVPGPPALPGQRMR